MTVYTGMFYVTGSHYSYMNNQYLSWFFLACIVVPNVIFLAYWAFNMRLEVIKEVHKKNFNHWIFKSFACQSSEKFYDMYMREEEE